MQSKLMTPARQIECASKTFKGMTRAVAIGLAGFAITTSPASALTGAGSALQHQFKQDSPVLEVVVRYGAVARPGHWVRPAHYTLRPGGAISAGAAIGFVTAATAAPGYCWSYTDPSKTQGFWDVCP